jgi:signal transduction histidine kinase
MGMKSASRPAVANTAFRWRATAPPGAQVFPISLLQVRIPGADPNVLSNLIWEQPGIGMVACNSHGRITTVNIAAKRLAQTNPEGKSLSAAPRIWGEMFDVNGRGIPATEWPWYKALQGETTLGSECRLVWRTGDSHEVLFGAYPIKGTDSRTMGVLASLVDITERNRRELTARADAVLDERSRMAADIHDTLIQGLNAILLQLEAVEAELVEQPVQARQRLRRLRDFARENLVEARRSIWSLSGNCSDEDPAVALAFVAHKLFQGIPIQVELNLEKGGCKLNPQLRLGILRIGKEALTNVLKHARATTVKIELSYDDRFVRLSIFDNGRGFVAAPTSGNQRGFGLFGLRTRAESIGGRLMLQSRPGRGTQVVATIPLPRTANAG